MSARAVIVCEPQCRGSEHARVNAALLASLKTAYADRGISFLAAQDHIEQVSACLSEHSVGGIDFQAAAVSGLRENLAGLGAEFRLARKAFGLAKQTGAERVLFSSVTCPGLYAIKIAKRLYPRVQSAVIIHSILATILPSLRPYPHKSKWGWFRTALQAANSAGLRLVVVSPAIRERLIAEMPSLERFAACIDLPYFFADAAGERVAARGPVRFGSLGAGSKQKGIDLFYRLASEVVGIVGADRAQFRVVGWLAGEIDERWRKAPVQVSSVGSQISRQDYDALARQIDYSVFFHDSQIYQLSGSGAVFDAFSYLTPIIALANPVFEDYFRRMGDIGYVCGSYEEVRQVVLDVLSAGPADRYARQQSNLFLSRELFGLDRIGAQLADILG